MGGVTVTRKSPLKPIELPNGAVVCCKHDFLPIAKRGGVWLHIYNGEHLCRPACGGRPAGPYVAEPYMYPLSMRYLS